MDFTNFNRAKCMLIIPALLVAAHAQADDSVFSDASYTEQALSADAFSLNSNQLAPIRFSTEPSARAQAKQPSGSVDHRTEFSFQLKAERPDFSRDGGFGLNMFGTPEIAIQTGKINQESLQDIIPALHDGLSYSAGFKVEHEDEAIDGTAYVSSSLLGLSYGRLGRVWYGGLGVNLEQFADANGDDTADVLSLDLTTGRRLGFTGLDAGSPLWLLSLHGDVDVQQQNPEEASDWYLNPSLFWQQPGFTFSAQVQVPVERVVDDVEKPDYRLRAVFEKQFK